MKAIGRLFFAAVLAFTLCCLLALANEGLLKLLGHDVAATVISLHEHPDPSGLGSRYAKYTYTTAGRPPRDDRSLLKWRPFRDLSMPFIRAGQRIDDMTFPEGRRPTLPVRAYAIGPLVYSRAVEHEWGMMLWLVPALFAAAFGFLSLALYVAMFVRPRQRRRLYTHGAAVPGNVTGGLTYRGRHGGTLYFVDYQFTPAGGSTPISGRVMVAGPDEYAAATAGKTVTVLHDPERPKRNTVYEFGGYRCV